MLIDISRPIHPNMAVYPGNPAVEFDQIQRAEEGESALTRISLGSHTGTHIDAPAHITEGADGTASYALEQMNGSADVVAPVSDAEDSQRVITAEHLPDSPAERILFKTRNSEGDVETFDPDFIALDESAAAALVRRGIKLVGIDALSVKKKGAKDAVHSILLDAGVVILEGLWLADVEPGSYELLALPLAVDLDGAPVRVALRQ